MDHDLFDDPATVSRRNPTREGITGGSQVEQRTQRSQRRVDAADVNRGDSRGRPSFCGRDLCLFELGSTSLKCHFRGGLDRQVRKETTPWNLGHEIIETGKISNNAMRHAVKGLRDLLSCWGPHHDPEEVLAFATGVFRICVNAADFFDFVKGETGIKVEVISGDQEAALLKARFVAVYPHRPALAFDLGGGTLQWVCIYADGSEQRGSLPAGVIGVHQTACREHGTFRPELAYEELGRHLKPMIPRVKIRRLTGTGGTLKAIRKVLDRKSFSRGDLELLHRRIEIEGPPPVLKSHRRPLFLPGIVVVRRIMDDVGAQEVCYENLSVGEVMLEKVFPFYAEGSEGPNPIEVLRRIHFSGTFGSRTAETQRR